MSVSEATEARAQVATTPGFITRALDVLERGDAFVALGLIWFVMLSIQNASPNIIGIDGYYHVKFALLMREHGLRLDFPWLPLTILNPRDFTDHHLLYHVLLIPFTFGDLRLGGKAAGLVFGVAAIFTAYWVMARLRVRYPHFWLLALIGSGEWFLAREAMTRRQSVSLVFLLLATYLLANGRFRLMLPLAFAYAWLFDGFVLLVAVAGGAVAARLLADRRLAWPALGWTVLGLALALLLNPYFPNDITFTVQHVLPKALPQSEVQVGNEWYPYAPSVLLRTSWLALLLVPLGLLPAAFAPRRFFGDRTALFLGGLAFMFLALYLRSRRFIETEPAFAALFCAYTWTHFFPALRGRSLADRLPLATRAVLAFALVLGVSYQAWLTTRQAQRNARDNHIYTTFQAASLWLAANTQPLEPVYQTDWDDFPELFFYNTHNTYIVGLDPTYMFLENPDLYKLWRSIGRGEVQLPSRAIREQFQARWVITDRQHRGFIDQAAADPGLEIAFESPGAIVYHVKDG